jgi:hypothetical protein
MTNLLKRLAPSGARTSRPAPRSPFPARHCKGARNDFPRCGFQPVLLLAGHANANANANAIDRPLSRKVPNIGIGTFLRSSCST